MEKICHIFNVQSIACIDDGDRNRPSNCYYILYVLAEESLSKNLYDVFQQAKADNKTANVAAIMDTWILQMGYPVVTVTRNLDAGTAQVTQARFLLDPGQKPSTIYTSPYSYVFQAFLRGLNL